MDFPLMSTSGPATPLLVSTLPVDGLAAEPESVVTVQSATNAHGDSLEPGEVAAPVIKQETTHDGVTNPTTNHHPLSNEPANRNGSLSLSPGRNSFASVLLSSTQAVSPSQYGPQSGLDNSSRSSNAIQRRNHARLDQIIHRLQHFSGSVNQLLAIANVQHQLDIAFVDLDRAKDQLKDVIRQFELEGHISGRQAQKKNTATKELSRASQRVVQLTKELCEVQRRGS
ncbi:hypothetical protein F4808DRAFT_320342 [Astrocystis sublimbata]|nr:hypothetical protein F4808DRAFT_320342 [Astrocystis sublimbata]